MSNVTIMASNQIEITAELKGADNKFIIEPAITQEDKDRIDTLLKDIEKNETEINMLEDRLASKKPAIEDAKDTMASLKELIARAKSEGKPLPKAHLDTV